MSIVKLKIEEVWATVDVNYEFPYIDIFTIKEDALFEMSQNKNVSDVIRGWYIRGLENEVIISVDFYWTKEQLKDDLFDRIIPFFKSKNTNVIILNENLLKEIEVLEKPLTIHQVLTIKNEQNEIEGIVKVQLNEIIGKNNEEFLDLLAEKIVNDGLLWSISYKVVGYENDSILLMNVSGDVTPLLEKQEIAV